MKVKSYRIALSLVIVLVVAATALAFGLHRPPSAEGREASGIQPVQAAYYLKEYQDKIGVFRPEEAEPFMTIDVYVSTLPAADQMELRTEGIQVADDRKLQTMIEDYES